MKELILQGPCHLTFRTYSEVHPGPGEVLLQTHTSGISTGTELRRFRGFSSTKHWDKHLRLYQNRSSSEQWPLFLGYETIAQVVAVGPDVDEHLLGCIVWADRPHRETHIVPVQEACYGMLLTPTEAAGYTPEDLARFIFLVRTRVALNGIHDASIHLGDRVAVIGCGVIGLLTLQLAHLSGASIVYAVDPLPHRLSLAASFGGTPIAAQGDPALEIKKQTGGVDVALETSGSYQGLHTAIQTCQMAGRVVTISTYHGSSQFLSLADEWSRNRITLVSSMSTNGCPSRLAPLWDKTRLDHYAIHLLKSETLQTTPLITHRFPFLQAEEAFRLLDQNPQDTLQVVFSYMEEGKAYDFR